MHLSPSYTLGLLFIFLVSLIWAAASVLVQYIYSDKVSFDSPFLLTYTGVSLFTCFLPARWILNQCRQQQQSAHEPLPLAQSIDDMEDEEGDAHIPTPPAPTIAVWTTKDHMVAAAKIAPVWFISNYAYNASLKYTSITSSTVLASTGSLFTFLFALISRDEHFSLYKFFGILLGMAGSIMTGLHDVGETHSASDSTESTTLLWGDFLGLLSAIGYGGYTLMVRLLCPRDESLMSMDLFLGFVGLWNLIFLSPIAIYQGVMEAAGLTWFIFGCLVIKGLFDNVLSDYLWARAVILTSATVATVGLGLTIPLAFASDVVMGRPNILDVTSIIGALSVLCGFVLVNLGQQQEEEQDEEGRSHNERHSGIPEQYGYSDDIDEVEGSMSSQATGRLPLSVDPYRDDPNQDGSLGGTE